MSLKKALSFVIVCCSSFLILSHEASALPTIKVGKITSEKQCTLYQNSSGSASLAVTDYSMRASASWRTWWVKDCVDNFASMKGSIESALASSGKLAVSSGTASYIVSGHVSAEGTRESSVSDQNSRQSDYYISSNKIFVTMNVSLLDSSGKSTFGSVITKEIEIGSEMSADGINTSNELNGQAIYAKIQNEMALAIARKIAFHIEPLRVIGGDGKTIQLNYGAPYLQLGTIVQVISPDGRAIIRYNVVGSDANRTIAQADSSGDTSLIVIGSTATIIEADDPAANGRRMNRVDLP